MSRLLLVLLACGLMAGIQSCYYDKEQLLYANSSAGCTDSTGTVSYTQKVVPIFSNLCYSCHAGNTPSGNIQMGTYAFDKAIAQNGKLWGSIDHASGYVPMPEGASKMTDCQLAVIRKWINSGMLNN